MDVASLLSGAAGSVADGGLGHGVFPAGSVEAALVSIIHWKDCRITELETEVACTSNPQHGKERLTKNALETPAKGRIESAPADAPRGARAQNTTSLQENLAVLF